MSERVVVVTGATGGLGKAVVEAFEQQGDTVAAVSRSAPEYPADLTRPEEAERVIGRILERFGRIDVLVHAMGGFAGGAPVGETPLEVWTRMWMINFQSAAYVFRCVVPPMAAAGRGRLIAVGSRAGVQPAAGAGAYNASKAALHTLVETIAHEVKDAGLTANVVLPSTIDTEANRAWGSAGEAARWVQPSSIAATIVWLASEAARDINGALIPVYGRA